MKNIEAVNKLRAMIAQKQNPVCQCPGVYCWWFKQDVALELLKAFPEFDRDKLQSRQIDGETYLALYFGISKNLKERIEWHVSQQHTPSAVKSGKILTATALYVSIAKNVKPQLAQLRPHNAILSPSLIPNSRKVVCKRAISFAISP